MNFVYISPHFPPAYIPFVVELSRQGITVLGIGDAPYEELSGELQNALTEYYRVSTMENRPEMEAACRHFVDHYGSIDRIESNNEYWLDLDAHLREMFDVPGLKPSGMELIKSKKAMKEGYHRAGVEVVEGIVVNSLEEALPAAAAIGYPVVLKPDRGVGSNFTEKISSEDELRSFFDRVPPASYIMEEFIVGSIQTFEALFDKNGELGFYSSFHYAKGVMETTEEQLEVIFNTQHTVPPALLAAGLATAKAFDVRERMVHFEYFVRHRDGSIVGLETNMRPPGAPCVDVINFANDIDLYREYARMVATGGCNPASRPPEIRKYVCTFVGRRTYLYDYVLTHEDIMNRYKHLVCACAKAPELSWQAMGDVYYLLRSANEQELKAAVGNITARR